MHALTQQIINRARGSTPSAQDIRHDRLILLAELAEAFGGGGGGGSETVMLKSTYDSEDNGIVDVAQRLESAFNAQTGTTYTLVAADNGKIVTLNNGSAITVTVPASLGATFRCTLLQLGAGLVSLTADGTTLNSSSGVNALSGQHSSGILTATAANVFNFFTMRGPATGWTAATGTHNRAAYATFEVFSAAGTYDPGQIDAITAAIAELSRRFYSLETDLTTQRIIGS